MFLYIIYIHKTNVYRLELVGHIYINLKYYIRFKFLSYKPQASMCFMILKVENKSNLTKRFFFISKLS